MKLKRTIPTVVAALALTVTAAAPALAAESLDSTARAAWAGAPHPGVTVVHTAVSELLGISDEDLVAARTAGQSLADIAAEKGVSTEALISTIVQARQGSIEEAVAAGTLTQERADAMLEHMTERVAERVADPSVGPRGTQGAGGGAGMLGSRGQGQGIHEPGTGGGMGRFGAGGLGINAAVTPAA
ncbi:MAG: hypothetical protein ACYCX3_12760 [Thermoleophilia bacterium]